MEKLKIIFANRKDCFEKPGGDTVQMMKTKEYLEQLYPVEIKICLTPEEILQDNEAEIVHIFNIQTINQTNAFIDVAKKSNKKICLSTIYWNLLDSYYQKYLSFINFPVINVPEILKLIFIKVCNLCILSIPFLKNKYNFLIEKGLFGTKKYYDLRHYACNNSDILLPNSIEEAEICIKEFNISDRNKIIVVPNAVDSNISKINSDISEYHLPEKYIVCAGRISLEKNQLSILKALFAVNIGIVFIGGCIDENYFKKIKEISSKRENVFFIQQVNQEKLFKIFKGAVCHILPSFRESPGLVSIEALLVGCNIIVSGKKYCPVSYYNFDKYGEICDPYSPKSIREAVFRIMNKNKKVELSPDYIYKVSYENVAKLTYEAYQKLLR